MAQICGSLQHRAIRSALAINRVLMSDVDIITSSVVAGSAPSTDVAFTTAAEHVSSIGHSDYSEDGHGDLRHHDELDTDLSRVSSRASLHDSQSSEHVENPRHVSPPPRDVHAQNLRDERLVTYVLLAFQPPSVN